MRASWRITRDRGGERSEGPRADLDAAVARHAVGEQQQGVVGAGVAVDDDGIERPRQSHPHGPAQRGPRHVGVGQYIGKHGRHVGGDHAGALGQAGQRHPTAADIEPLDGVLGEGVGGHHALEGAVETVRRQVVAGALDAAENQLARQLATDATGRRRHHELLVEAETARHPAGHQSRQRQAVAAGVGVGVATVDQDRLRPSLGQPLLPDHDRRRLDAIGREDPHRRRRTLGDDQSHVALAALLQTAGNATEPVSGNQHFSHAHGDLHQVIGSER
jgi:hypothetical protein